MAAAEQEREELKVALISAQESAALQILLEVCIPTDVEKKVLILIHIIEDSYF